MNGSDHDAEERFLVVAPTGRDALLTCQLLDRAGMAAHACADVATLCDLFVREGAAGLMIAQEVLTSSAIATLTDVLQHQPAWSDVPVLLFTGHGADRDTRVKSLGVLGPLGNVTLLDRPLRPVTMQSAARAALRARRRQYEARAELIAQERAIRERDQFLAMLGHELRNPLAAISLASERLAQPGADVSRYRDVLTRQTSHLARLVDDLLDVSRVTSGKIALEQAPIDLGALVEEALQVMRAPQHRLSYAPPAAPVFVQGDAVRLEQIIVNLLTNAVKYTPSGGAIDLAVRRDGDRAVLEIRDTGVGIRREMLTRIFDLFAQAESTLERSQGGMGIGLTLVRSLVELHGGEVTVESDGPGRGSLFTVSLPGADAPMAVAVPPPPGPTVAAGPHDVLVVEDNLESRELLVELLADNGHHVDAAGDGPSAVERALAHPPEVALIDIGLPGFDGYSVARKVRAALGDGVYLIAMTGYGQPDDQRRALEAGFDVHLTKPVDVRALFRLLASR